jgi:amicyanin
MRRLLAILLIAAPLIAALMMSTGRAGEAVTAAIQQVSITGYKFDPDVLTIPAGTTVTWTNHDEVPHTVTSTDKSFTSSGALDTGDLYSYTFTKPGKYDYYCTVHPFMLGKVIVEAPKATTPATLKGG